MTTSKKKNVQKPNKVVNKVPHNRIYISYKGRNGINTNTQILINILLYLFQLKWNW